MNDYVLADIISKVDRRLNLVWGDDPLGCREAYEALELIRALAVYLQQPSEIYRT